MNTLFKDQFSFTYNGMSLNHETTGYCLKDLTQIELSMDQALAKVPNPWFQLFLCFWIILVLVLKQLMNPDPFNQETIS